MNPSVKERKMSRRAQSVLEYCVLICILVAALVAMQTYIKRGVQGRIRASADEIGGEFGYAPGMMNSTIVINKAITEESNSYTVHGSGSDNTTTTESSTILDQNTTKTEELIPG